MIYFAGTSHAAVHLREGARSCGLAIAETADAAELIFISEDTKTDDAGNRDVAPIREMVDRLAFLGKPLVLTSQVPPGFTRSLRLLNIHHQAETLRIKDAEHRALHPDYIAVGGDADISPAYAQYLFAFQCPVIRMSWEDAEFSKIAVNMMLAAQVDYTNRLSAAAAKVGADWNQVKRALHADSRIGHDAYLTPGRWQDSRHLLRDHVTLEAISTS